MTASIASAWVALRRRTIFWTVVGAATGFALLSTTIDFVTATATGAAADSSGPGPAGATIAELSKASGIVHGLTGGATFLGVVAIAVGGYVFASDFQNGTIRTLLVRQPQRIVFLAGKALALSGLLAGAAAVAKIASAALAFALAGGQGVDTSAWSAGELLAGWAGVSLAMIGFAILGGALGVLLRSPVAAIGLGVAWTLPLEQILSSAWNHASDVLPGQLLGDVAAGTATVAQGATLTLWVAALCGTAIWTFTRRDVRV